jgi:hypothetical protein
MPRNAKSVSEAQKLIRPLVNKLLKNENLGITGTLSNKSIDKMGSEKATQKSISPRLHAMAVANVDVLFENAATKITHDDYKGNRRKILIHRLNSLMFDETTNDYIQVMITVKEFYDGTENRIYSIEAIDTYKK